MERLGGPQSRYGLYGEAGWAPEPGGQHEGANTFPSVVQLVPFAVPASQAKIAYKVHLDPKRIHQDKISYFFTFWASLILSAAINFNSYSPKTKQTKNKAKSIPNKIIGFEWHADCAYTNFRRWIKSSDAKRWVRDMLYKDTLHLFSNEFLLCR
jgi:hypothetical protein